MMKQIIALAQKIFQDDTLELTEDTSIIADMELSSMEIFEFIAEVEREFSIHISERQLNQIDTLGDLYRIVKQQTAQ